MSNGLCSDISAANEALIGFVMKFLLLGLRAVIDGRFGASTACCGWCLSAAVLSSAGNVLAALVNYILYVYIHICICL